MTTQSQQQSMAQPDTARAGEPAAAQPGAMDGFVGAACGAGAGAAMIWQPVSTAARDVSASR